MPPTPSIFTQIPRILHQNDRLNTLYPLMPLIICLPSYAAYQTALDALILEPWIEFRAHLHDFDDFIDAWGEKLKRRVMERSGDRLCGWINEALEGWVEGGF
jgi:hypothetical protein